MNIRIKFLGVIYEVQVSIYDMYEHLIYSGQTSCGYVDVRVREGNVYKIIASMPYGMLTNYFYVGSRKIYYFMFPNLYMNDTNNVTLFLTDYFYPNLPIERGEITLWQR